MAVNRIAVVRSNHRLGNTLLLTPLVQELEARFPEARVDLITACGEAHTVFQRFERVSTAYTFPTKSFHHPARVLSLLWTLRRRSYDLAIDPIPRSRAGRFLLGQVRARDRLGFHWGVPGRDRVLTHVVDPVFAPVHFAQAPLYLLRSAYGALSRTAMQAPALGAVVPMDLRLSASERLDGERRLAGVLGSTEGNAHPRVGLFAHATGHKSYPVEWWRQLVVSLRRQAAAVQLLEFVPADGQPRLAAEIPSLYTPGLRLLGATLAATSLVVIPDGGVMHLAEAAGARLLGLFRTTDPLRYGPCRAMSEVLQVRDESAESVAVRILAMLNRTDAAIG